MSIQIPEIHKEFYDENGYYISKGHNLGNNPKKYIEKYASLIGKIINQESKGVLSKNIKPLLIEEHDLYQKIDTLLEYT